MNLKYFRHSKYFKYLTGRHRTSHLRPGRLILSKTLTGQKDPVRFRERHFPFPNFMNLKYFRHSKYFKYLTSRHRTIHLRHGRLILSKTLTGQKDPVRFRERHFPFPNFMNLKYFRHSKYFKYLTSRQRTIHLRPGRFAPSPSLPSSPSGKQHSITPFLHHSIPPILHSSLLWSHADHIDA